MPNYAKMHEEKRGLVERLIKDGLTKKSICEKSGIPIGTINSLLKRWGLRTKRAYTGNKTRGFKYQSRYNDKKDEVKSLLLEGRTLFDVADTTGIPRGSIAYVIKGWGFTGLNKKVRGGHLTKSGQKAMAKKISASHKRGRKHPMQGLVSLRGRWTKPQERLDAILECVEKDMTYAEMMSELELSQATIWSVLKKNDLLQGIRKGDRHPDWKGGHSKYRGPDWYGNRKLALERDNYTCQFCGKTNEEEWEGLNRGLSVHHKIPYEISQDSSLSNLITVCQSCHMMEEHKNGRHKEKYKHKSEG